MPRVMRSCGETEHAAEDNALSAVKRSHSDHGYVCIQLQFTLPLVCFVRFGHVIL
jgi:hypothetical protein